MVVLVVNAVVGLTNARNDHGRWGTVERGFFALSLALAVVVAIEVIRSGPRSAPLLRIGQTGLTVPDGDLVPWSDLGPVRVTRARWGTIRAVAFLPRPGGTVPAISPFGLRVVPGGGHPDRAAAHHGSALVVLPRQMTITAAQAIHAAQVFGHLGVTWAASNRKPTNARG